MSQNIIKSNIFYNENIFEGNAEIPIDVEFSLPDYCPDISKILKCRAVARISSKGISSNGISIDGCVTINLLYSNDESAIFAYEYQYPFNKILSCNEDLNDTNLSCEIRCEYINCRAISGRKVELHGAAVVSCVASKKCKREIISDIDCKNIESNRKIIPATTPISCADKYLLLEEEIEIGNSQPPIRCILKYDAKCCLSDVKIISGRVVVKGEILLPILYCSDNDGSLCSVKNRIPFSQIIEVPDINEECKCHITTQIAYVDLKLRNHSSGEANTILANIKILFCCEAFCDNDLTVITDVYSKKNLLNTKKENIEINKIVNNINDTHNLKYNTDLTDEIQTIIDIWCDIRNINKKFSDKKLCIFGDLSVGVVYLNKDNIPMFCERNFDFNYETEVDNETYNCKPEIEISSIGYFLTGEASVELRIELKVNAALYCSKSIPLLMDYSLSDKKPSNNSYGMLIYYSSAGESIWEIAKKYNSGKEEIMKINSLNEDTVLSDKMLLIPVN